MSTIVVLIVMMTCLIAVGRGTKKLGLREYLIIVMITVAQIVIVVLYMFTVERPPVS